MRRAIPSRMPLGDLRALPLVCAWKGCRATTANVRPTEPGWIGMATFRDLATPGILNFGTDWTGRDAMLCPEHAAALEACLKAIR